MTGSGDFRWESSGLVIVASSQLMKLKSLLSAFAFLLAFALVTSALAYCFAQLLVGGVL